MITLYSNSFLNTYILHSFSCSKTQGFWHPKSPALQDFPRIFFQKFSLSPKDLSLFSFPKGFRDAIRRTEGTSYTFSERKGFFTLKLFFLPFSLFYLLLLMNIF